MCYIYQDYEHSTQDYRWQPATAARSSVHIRVQQPTTSLLRLVGCCLLVVGCWLVGCSLLVSSLYRVAREVVAGDPGSVDRRGLHNAS